MLQERPKPAPLVDLATTEGDCASGMYRVGSDKDSNGDFNQGAGGKYIFLCFQTGCQATSVKGEWVPHGGQIVSVGSEKWSTGTSYEHSESKTEDWKESVSVKVSQDWTLFGNAGSVEITGTIAHDTSETYASSWSTTSSHSYEVDYTSDMIGKQAWQFQFSPSDSCGHTETGDVPAMAITAGAFQPPCCVPGYATDAPTYKVCHSADSMIYNGATFGCSVAAPANLTRVLV